MMMISVKWGKKGELIFDEQVNKSKERKNELVRGPQKKVTLG